MGSTGTVLRELRGAQKSAKGVSLYSRYVNRPAGRLLAAGAYRAGLTPNQVTLVSALFTYTALAAVALVEPSWTLGLLVYAALAIGFAFDSADGQLARLTGRGGPDGEWLDHVVDCGKLVLVHTAVLISFYRFGELPSDAWLLLPLGFQLAAVVTFCAGLLREKLGKAAVAGAPVASPVSRVRAVALLPADYGVFCLVFLLLGAPGAFRAGYAVLAVVHTLFLAAFLTKWFRELRALRPG
ncbi:MULTISPECIES: CDP-alcohol phosphatidyltransferase family protein [Streptomyces]|uniref:CDP-alcohol phosphatidyltransferase family protein n=1 Tax=Streptomyces TaxID=1883 RepID=UPI000978DD72|nr:MULTISPECIES: CDP-alcohol phosphatidyltransferase family protein [unclassified Streptomyces]ONI49337.1 CDP-alcohol phosphatidyltransferase [Streptomyces sp. IB2014 011-1]RDV51792.1 CDP-alcohol phosphatidyltransferase [Streptomyces sp. IB2014 011-12]CAD5933886.1 CDP-alcohol phosphatidyltransferase [Streptomyces sp. KY70]CAD5988164.1 CDP-alcohol phosphatidyltransferase [Streptomyces sp. KY75]